MRGGTLKRTGEKHKVRPEECEEAFFNRAFVAGDEKHSQTEERFYLQGQTNAGRKLFVVFTIRGNKIRVISARDMSRKERRIYENLKKVPSFKSEEEEFEFWSKNDSTEFIDWKKAQLAIFPDLKPTTKTISLRLPVSLLYRLKEEAHKRDNSLPEFHQANSS